MKMSNFIGKWVDDKDDPRSEWKEVLDSFDGLSDEEKKMWLESITTFEYKKDGDWWICSQSTTAMPGKTKDIRFQSGTPYKEGDIDGKTTNETTWTFVGDSEIKEVGTNNMYGPYEITRKIDGDRMKVISSFKGKNVTSYMMRT